MKISILGTGLIGAAAAEALLNSGHEIIVYNRTASKTVPLVKLGAKAVTSASEAIEMSDIILIVLPGSSELRDIILSTTVRPLLHSKKILNLSTTRPADIIEIGQEVEKLGGILAEVTVNSGPEQLRSKQGQFILGCRESEEIFWTGILHSMGDLVLRAGNLGAASNAEVPILLTSVLNLTTAAYVAASAIKLNIPRAIVDKFIAPTMIGGDYFLPKMLSRDYGEVMALIENYLIVAHNALNSMQSNKIPSKLLEEAVKLISTTSERGFKDKDGSSICEILLDPKTYS